LHSPAHSRLLLGRFLLDTPGKSTTGRPHPNPQVAAFKISMRITTASRMVGNLRDPPMIDLSVASHLPPAGDLSCADRRKTRYPSSKTIRRISEPSPVDPLPPRSFIRCCLPRASSRLPQLTFLKPILANDYALPRPTRPAGGVPIRMFITAPGGPKIFESQFNDTLPPGIPRAGIAEPLSAILII
jgi:hypothetical protein